MISSFKGCLGVSLQQKRPDTPSNTPTLFKIEQEIVGTHRNDIKPQAPLLQGLKEFIGSIRKLNWSGRQDLNLRPLAPHASALPNCATPRRRRELLSSEEARILP